MDLTPIMWCQTMMAGGMLSVAAVSAPRDISIGRKQDAIDYGRQVSRNQETELRIHNKDGRIGQSDSHGHDPNPPKG